MKALTLLQNTVSDCTRCPRLTHYRREVAQEKVKRFKDCEYWGRPIPGFGDPKARLYVLGLAPAAHGGNVQKSSRRQVAILLCSRTESTLRAPNNGEALRDLANDSRPFWTNFFEHSLRLMMPVA